MPERKISEFFENDLPAYASYDNVRKIANLYDGMKISMRKIIYTMLEKYPGSDKVKTDTVTETCAAFTNYVHGSANLGGVCDTMAQSFVGANNYPLLNGNSSGFGTRINPVCAASRYTKIALSKISEALFNKDDLEISDKQFFEGSYIEPKYFMPTFPILFLNGSHGISTGYAQDIYPRNPKEIIKYIKCKLDNKKFNGNLLPWFKGFNGSIKINNDTNKVECWGSITKNNSTSYTITELPIGMEYSKYIEVLDKLCDNNTIVDYTDKCDTKTDNILFDIKTTRAFSEKYNNEADLYSVLKLIKTLPETLCCIDENNRVKEYNNIIDILNDFIEARLDFYSKRKQRIIDKLNDKINLLSSKYTFCKSIINKDIIISNKKKQEIIDQIDKIGGMVTVDGTYNYLLNMPIHSISKDTLSELEKEIKDIKLKHKEIKSKSINDLWIDDLDKLEQYL